MVPPDGRATPGMRPISSTQEPTGRAPGPGPSPWGPGPDLGARPAPRSADTTPPPDIRPGRCTGRHGTEQRSPPGPAGSTRRAPPQTPSAPRPAAPPAPQNGLARGRSPPTRAGPPRAPRRGAGPAPCTRPATTHLLGPEPRGHRRPGGGRAGAGGRRGRGSGRGAGQALPACAAPRPATGSAGHRDGGRLERRRPRGARLERQRRRRTCGLRRPAWLPTPAPPARAAPDPRARRSGAP